MLRPGAKGEDRIGELYYALFVRIRPKTEAETKAAQNLGGKEDGLWTEADAKAVDVRYQVLKTRNIKHFPNPLVGDTNCPWPRRSSARGTASRSVGSRTTTTTTWRRSRWRSPPPTCPTSAGSATRSPTDGFACHFLTDAFCGSHARTPRASIEAYWDKKVPGFEKRLENWLADEATLVVVTHPKTRVRKRGLPKGIEELGAGSRRGRPGLIRD